MRSRIKWWLVLREREGKSNEFVYERALKWLIESSGIIAEFLLMRFSYQSKIIEKFFIIMSFTGSFNIVSSAL